MPKKKNSKAKLPKAVAGVAIPKHLRNAVEPVFRFAGNPIVSNLLASALVAGAEHLLEVKRNKSASGKAEGSDSMDSKARKASSDNIVGLLLAVAAGEIASHIVAAYQAPPEAAPKAAKPGASTKNTERRITRPRRKKDSVPAD